MARCLYCDWENADGAHFCANPDCGKYIGWKDGPVAAATTASPPPAPPAPGLLPPEPPRRAAAGPNAPTAPSSPASPPAPVAEPNRAPAREATPAVSRAAPKYQLTRQRADPVLVERVDSPPPAAAAGVSAKDGKQGIFIAVDHPSSEVVPGGESVFSVRVRNTGSLVERITVGVADLPTEWVSVVPPDLKLDVGEEAVTAVHIRPPRDATARPGPLPFTLSAWSTTNPNVRCQEPCHLTIGTFGEARLTIDPAKATGRGPAQFRLRFENHGNRALRGRALATVDTGRVDLDPAQIDVAPGQAVDVAAKLVPRSRLITGTPSHHTVTVGFDGTPPVPGAVFQYQQLPRLTRLVARILTVLLVALLAAGALVVRTAWVNRDRAVPDVLGKAQAAAEADLRSAGFDPVVREAPNETVGAGLVVEQAPDPGVERSKGDDVVIGVSTGPVPRAVPDLRGMPVAEATALVTEQGLAILDNAEPVPDDAIPAGAIVSQEPGPATEVAKGTQIKVVVSAGPRQVVVPDLYAQNYGAATAMANAEGLEVRIGDQVPDDRFVNQVVAQDPPAGTTVTAGTTIVVTLAIASGA